NLSDDALDAALPLIKQGGDEGLILAAMQGAVFAGGGRYRRSGHGCRIRRRCGRRADRGR
ncbi:MAG: hypothetical protein E5V99_24985, partial [Mesorhizobium sp.]